MDLIVDKPFLSHSGKKLSFKIMEEGLSDGTIKALAKIISKRFKFRKVIGVPKGGNRLAKALKKYRNKKVLTTLIVDDVFTTGKSMIEARKKLLAKKANSYPIGVVIFTRSHCPSWITPIFNLDHEFRP